jgi:hypothetical protein
MSPAKRDARWGLPAFLAGLTVFFYWKILFTNRAIFPWDAADFFYPAFSFVHEEVRHLRLPLWDPYVMAGYPIIGDPEAQTFYPINWLFILLHPFSALPYRLVEGQIILHFFLAGLFFYYLARSFVQSATAALCGAVLFQFSGAMVAHTQHLASIDSMAWYPLIFLLARRGLLEGKIFLTASAGMLFGIQTLTGHWQHSVYLGMLLFLYFAYEACCGPARAKLWPRWIYFLLIIGGVGACLAMVQVIPTHELGNLSVRSYLTYDDVTLGNDPRFLWTLFLPNYFGGLNGAPHWYPYDLSFNYVFLTVPGCLLALLGLIETVRWRNFFWLGMVLLSVDLSIGRAGHLAQVVYHLPILNLFRNIATFFDLANFVLCLMAAIGAQSLLSRTPSRPVKEYLPAGLTVLLFSAGVLGIILRLGEKISGWYHMLAVLALVSVVVTALLRDKLSPPVAQWLLLGLMAFDLFFYGMNQPFNGTLDDPQKYLTHDLAGGQGGTLRFLRSDPASDFRVAAVAEYDWSGNGWNVWRIPGIFGWNPVTIGRYQKYIREFTETSDITLPYGGPDHNLDSAMFDLLGAKYLVMADAEIEKKLRLRESNKFELIFEDLAWWRTYRNKNYLSRAWFYPQAYIVPGEEQAFALMSSRWFDARKTLVFEKADLPREGARLAEELSAITLRPGDFAAASNGRARPDSNCADHLPMFTDWGKQGNWVRYDIPGQEQPARYLLTIEYTAAGQTSPSLETELENGGRKQHSGPVTLPATYDWGCTKSRMADLGAFEMAPGSNRLTITSRVESGARIYGLRLIRLPSSAPAGSGTFSFDDFSIAANRIAFRSHLSSYGFVLFNEIYYPGWQATVDGKPAEILRADGIFRALFVSAGDHRLEFRFRPRHFAWGAAISLLTVIGYVAYTLARRQRGPDH